MRISDWSSDVCSSDLCRSGVWIGKAAEAQPRPDFFRATGSVDAEREFFGRRRFDPDADAVAPATGAGGLNAEGRKAVASHEEPGRRHRLGMGDAHDPGGPAAVIEEEVYRRREKTFGHGTAEDPFELLDALDPNRGRDRPTLGDAGEAGDVVQDAADWGPAAPAAQADTGSEKTKSGRHLKSAVYGNRGSVRFEPGGRRGI